MASFKLQALPLDILKDVVSRLSHVDVANLQKAGLAAGSHEICDVLHREAALNDDIFKLLAAMPRIDHIKCLNRSETSTSYSPSVASNAPSALLIKLSPATGVVMLAEREEDWPPSIRSVANYCEEKTIVRLRSLSPKIVELLIKYTPNLRHLCVTEEQFSLRSITDHLGYLHQLRVLRIQLMYDSSCSIDSYIEVLPAGILQLGELRMLYLINFKYLKHISKKIGHRLPNLCYAHLDVGALTTIPRSLVDTLERNTKEDCVSHGLHITKEYGGIELDEAFWEKLLPQHKYPILSSFTGSCFGPSC